jgi:plastocyanin
MNFRLQPFVIFVLAGVALALTVAPIGKAAENGSVSGTVTATGLSSAANIVVSLHAPGVKTTPPTAAVQMDQKSKTFTPHVLPIVQGTTVKFLNSDPFEHNVFSPEGKYDLGSWPRGQSKDHKFDKPGVYTQLCRIHHEMAAYVIVLDTPYFATTDASGAFKIADVPAGAYTLTAWSEKLKEGRQPVTVEAGKATTVKVTLKK